MLRNPIYGDFSGGGGPDSPPPLEFAHVMSPFHGFAWKLTTFAHWDRDMKLFGYTVTKTRFTFSACASNTVGFMVVSCADPGIFARGRGSEKKIWLRFFRHQLFYSFKEGYQWFILKKTIFFKVPEGVQHFTGEGVQIFPGWGGGGQMLI